MPTILSHPALPLALAYGLGPSLIPPRLLWAGLLVSIAPDLDVIAFHMDIPYAAPFGHRGLSHSLLFALLLAGVAATVLQRLGCRFSAAFGFLAVAAASHGVLDAFTSGGLGVAFFWPWSEVRFFAPVRPIRVAPLGLGAFLTWRGAAVLGSEILWVWLPLLGLAGLWAAIRRRASRPRTCAAEE